MTTNTWREIERKWTREEKETDIEIGEWEGGKEGENCVPAVYTRTQKLRMSFRRHPFDLSSTRHYGWRYPINLWPLLKLKAYVSCRRSLKRAQAAALAIA